LWDVTAFSLSLKLRQYNLKQKLTVYNAFKDDINKLAELKQQISQKMIILVQHMIAKLSLYCEVIPGGA